MSLSDDMVLDPQDLDRAALDQPSIYVYWGEKWAKAIMFRDKLKELITATKAKVIKEIRNYPDKFGWENSMKAPSESWINSMVEFHPKVVGLYQQLSELQNEVNMMQVAVEACNHRLKSLSILAELYKGNYFAASSRGSKCHITALENSEEERRQKISNHPKMQELKKKKLLKKKEE